MPVHLIAKVVHRAPSLERDRNRMDNKQLLSSKHIGDEGHRDHQRMHSHDLWLPPYETPGVISFTDEDILEELGPAQTNVYSDRTF